MNRMTVRASVLVFVMLVALSDLFAQGAKVFIQPTRLTYPAITVGQDTVRTFVIYNFDTTKTLHGHIDMPTSGNFLTVASDTFSLSPRTNDTVRVHFRPQVAGVLLDSMYVAHDGDTTFTKSPTKIRLSGTAYPVNDTNPHISLNFTSISLRTYVDSAVTQTLKIRNTADSNHLLIGVVTGIHAPFTFVGDSTFSLGPHDSASIVIRYSPLSSASATDSLLVTSNADSAHRLLIVTLRGSTIMQVDTTRRITLSLNTLTFDSIPVGTDSVRSFSIRNTSQNTELLVGTVSGPSAPFSLVSDSSRFSLAPGATYVARIQYHAVAAGAFQDSIVVNSNATGANSRVVVHLSASTPAVVQQGVAQLNSADILMEITPNPATSEIEFTIAERGRGDLSIVDEQGRVVAVLMSGELTGKLRWNGSGLPIGNYFVRLRVNGVTVVKKLAITH